MGWQCHEHILVINGNDRDVNDAVLDKVRKICQIHLYAFFLGTVLWSFVHVNIYLTECQLVNRHIVVLGIIWSVSVGLGLLVYSYTPRHFSLSLVDRDYRRIEISSPLLWLHSHEGDVHTCRSKGQQKRL